MHETKAIIDVLFEFVITVCLPYGLKQWHTLAKGMTQMTVEIKKLNDQMEVVIATDNQTDSRLTTLERASENIHTRLHSIENR